MRTVSGIRCDCLAGVIPQHLQLHKFENIPKRHQRATVDDDGRGGSLQLLSIDVDADLLATFRIGV
jgi:hypothetical protein